MHCELVNETLFDEDEELPKDVATTSKRVNSEEFPNLEISSTGQPKKKKNNGNLAAVHKGKPPW
jgi:hypothetical protein